MRSKTIAKISAVLAALLSPLFVVMEWRESGALTIGEGLTVYVLAFAFCFTLLFFVQALVEWTRPK